MKFAITGATGFLGSHLAEGMQRDGHELTLLVRDPAKLTPALRKCRLVKGDLLDPTSLRAAFAGADAVVHAAAYVGEWGPPEAYFTANVDGTRNVIDACAAASVKRLLHISTNSVYGEGDRDNVALPEETPYRKTGQPYGDSKIEAEAMVFKAHEEGKLVASAIRPTMIWGPRDRQFLPKVIDAIEHGVMMYLGGGRKLLGLAHVENVVELARLILAKDVSHGRAYNVDDDDRRTMRDLCRALCARLGRREPWMTMPTSAAKALGAAMEAAWRAAGAKSPPLITKMGAGLMCYDNDVSVERAKRELGYRPQDLFEQRLDDYLRSNRAGE